MMSYFQILTHESDDSYPAFLNRPAPTVALVDQTVDDRSIAVTTKMEVTRDPIDFKKPFHPAPLLLVDILNHSIKLLIIVHILIAVDHVVWNYYLL